MTRSPAYGRRTRPPHRRRLVVLGVERIGPIVRVAVAGEDWPLVTFEAPSDTAAIVMLELLRQGAFSWPINPHPDVG